MMGRQRWGKVPAVVDLVLMTLTLKLSTHLQIVVHSLFLALIVFSDRFANFVAFP